MQTLEKYLTQVDPEVVLVGSGAEDRRKRPGTNTRNNRYPSLENARINRWKDFTRKNLYSCFGGKIRETLQREHSDLPDSGPLHETLLRIKTEPNVTALVNLCHLGRVLAALDRTAQEIVEQRVEMIEGSHAGVVYADTRLAPDWAGTRSLSEPDPRQIPDNILPGDNKTSWTWSTEHLSRYLSNKGPESSVWPLRQIVCYCIRSYARYGYIITNEELFVVRVGTTSQGETLDSDPQEFQETVFESPLIEYASIPWKKDDGKSKNLTVTLALWVLHLLAANEGYLQAKRYPALVKTEKAELKSREWFPPSYVPRSGNNTDKGDDDYEPDSQGIVYSTQGSFTEMNGISDGRRNSSYDLRGSGKQKRKTAVDANSDEESDGRPNTLSPQPESQKRAKIRES